MDIKKFKKIEIAEQFLVDQYEEIAYDLLREVFGIKGAFVTDESSLYDFDFELTENGIKRKKFLEKIEEIYGVDVSDIEDMNIVEVCKRISILGNK